MGGLLRRVDWTVILWYVVVGVVLVTVGAAGPVLKPIWVSISMIYLGIGILLGPMVLGLLNVTLIEEKKPLEHLTEAAVVISLFAAGLRMRMPLMDKGWLAPAILATVTMVTTVALTAAIGYWWLGLSLGMAVLLGAVLAPTDPVLASEVQVENPDDKDRLRLMLTGEAGLNDGTAFPFVLLAVGLVGLHIGEPLHPLGEFGWKWVTIDLLWRVVGGLLIGWYGGCWLAAAATWCRQRIKATTGSDELLSIGLIALIYGIALLAMTYAFLAVFAAAVAFRRRELADNADKSEKEAMAEASDAATRNLEEEDAAPQVDEHRVESKEQAAVILARDQMEVADTLERLVQVILVVLVGVTILPTLSWDLTPWFVAIVLLFVVRPLAVLLTVYGGGVLWRQRLMTAWFGIRGIGTLYYLTHAFGLGVSAALYEESRLVADVCLATITLSIILHGTSVTPLMKWYENRCEKDDQKSAEPSPA